MADLVFNPTMVAQVTAYEYGPEETNPETGETFRPVIGILPGERIDVQSQCIAQQPALTAFVVEPDVLLHDCGPNGVRLFAETPEELMAAAPPNDPPSPWDICVEVADEVEP